jgi:preprotein translocase subunit SecG
MGGSSAFGAKAGDVFTRITIVTAAIWIVLCVVAVKALNRTDPVDVTTTAPPSGSISAPAGSETANESDGAQQPAQTPPAGSTSP